MRNYMKDYINEIDEIIKNENSKNISEIINIHLIKINFFQHERLVHFLVTFLFAIMFLITFLYSLSNVTIGLLLLDIMFVILLIPYIYHYYYLENSVQYMYKQFDNLKKIEKKSKK